MRHRIGLLLSAGLVAGCVWFLLGTFVGRAALAYVRPAEVTPLAASPNVSFEPGGEALARSVAALLPAAIARVESAEGLRFARPAEIRVFASWAGFEAYGGGSRGPAGVTTGDRISLSPVLVQHPERLRAILTHELSHALIHQVLGWHALMLPAWFDEGLAVLVSDGGGAEAVSPDEARAALAAGRRFVPDEAELVLFRRYGSSFGLSGPMFYRQAGLFVGAMAQRDPAAFRRVLEALAAGDGLGGAVRRAYGRGIDALWQDFLRETAG